MLRTLQLTNRFASKMILAFLLIILIPTIFTSFSFYLESSSIVRNNVRESTIQITKQTADALSSIFSVGSDTSDYIYGDLQVQQAAMNASGRSLDEQVEVMRTMSSLLNNIVYSSSFVKIVYVIKEDGIGWGSGTFSPTKLKRVDLTKETWVQEAKRRDGELVWEGLHHDQFSGAADNTDLVLPIARTLKDFQTLDQIGLVVVNLDGRAILDTIGQVKLGKTGKFFVVDSKGTVMIDSDLGLVGNRVQQADLYHAIVGNDDVEFEYAVDGTPYYGVKQLLSNGWIIVGTVPVGEITGGLDHLQHRILLTSLLFGMVAVVVGFIIASRVTKPINQLTKDMRRVQQGDLKVRTDIQSTDEIGLMSKQFNKMLQEIEQLMVRVEEEESQKRHAQVRAVMHRIQPHFLFNTLSTLRWLIRSGDNVRAEQGLSALTRLLEANMGKRGTMVTIEEELDIVQKYLAILEIRYEKSFVLHLHLETGTEGTAIPNMLLQPLVENAVFHGFVPYNRDGLISIEVTKAGDAMEITIRDNGSGMPEETLNMLNQLETAESEANAGIGVRHVYDSIRLYYGQGSGLTFHNNEDGGVCVRIILKTPVGGVSHVSRTDRR